MQLPIMDDVVDIDGFVVDGFVDDDVVNVVDVVEEMEETAHLAVGSGTTCLFTYYKHSVA